MTVFTNGIPSNSTIILVTKANPAVSGQTSGGPVGGMIFDTITLTGGYQPTGTVTFTLYGPDDNDCSNGPVFTSTKTLDSNGQATSDDFTPTEAGTYHWVVTYSGDPNNNLVTTDCGDPEQTVVVAPPAEVAQVGNLSGWGNVGLDDDVLIGGFIISGASPRQVLLRGIGPSTGVEGALADPILELHGPNGFTTIVNDNWQGAGNFSQIPDALQPQNPQESSILVTLSPGAYTAIVRGSNDTTGIALVEIYDLSTATDSQLANVSTRAFVETGDNVLIGGVIITGAANANTVLRAIGPSLVDQGVTNALSDPLLNVYDGNGSQIASNDNWREDPGADQVSQAGLAPTNDLESALYLNVAPGGYTVIVSGGESTNGIGLVEIYSVN